MNSLLDYGSDGTDDDNAKEDQGEENRVQPQETNNFFNLNPSVEFDEEEPKIKQLKKELTTSSGLTVEVPSNEFWEPVSSDDIKFVAEKWKASHNKRECNAVRSVGRGSSEPDSREWIHFEYKTRSLRHASSRYKYDHSHTVATTSENEQTGYARHVSSGNLEQRQAKSVVGQVKNKIGENNVNSQINSRKLFFLHSKIKSHLNGKLTFRIPHTVEKDTTEHAGPVNRLKWNIAIYSHLLMSVSMDGTVKVWNFWSSLDPCVKTLNIHTKAVRDACWGHSGKEIISCGYDKLAILSDVDTGQQLTNFQHENYVNCVKCHPDNNNIFVSGSYSILQAWDRRTPHRPVREFIYKDNTGQVQDVIFSADGSSMFSSCDLLSRDSADRNVMAWDFSSGVVLSNQIYQERYSCTRLKLHPTEGYFLAQTNGDYIAIFSTHKPYKLNKAKRFQGHKGNGYAVGFDLSVDGSLVVSGSADGNTYFYNYHSGRLLRTLTTGLDICTDVAIHPVLTSTVACCGWNGHVQVWR